MEQLMGQTDAHDGRWKKELKPLIDAFTAQHPGVFDNVNARQIARTFYKAVHADFFLRTRGYWSPLCLIFGVLDEKGGAVQTANELVALAGPQGPMVGFPQRLAYDPTKADPSSAESKGRLHEGIDSLTIVKAVKDVRYRGVALYWLDDLWQLVVKLSHLRQTLGGASVWWLRTPCHPRIGVATSVGHRPGSGGMG
eukprot:3917597-Prymnesium_polylepis.1